MVRTVRAGLVICLLAGTFTGGHLGDIEYTNIEYRETKGIGIRIDYNTCNAITYDTDDYLDSCHHQNFPNETISEVFGESVPECCGFHGYFGYGACDGQRCQEIDGVHKDNYVKLIGIIGLINTET